MGQILRGKWGMNSIILHWNSLQFLASTPDCLIQVGGCRQFTTFITGSGKGPVPFVQPEIQLV